MNAGRREKENASPFLSLKNRRDVKKQNSGHVVSECPLAREHILQGVERLDGDAPPDVLKTSTARHPIELIAYAYRL